VSGIGLAGAQRTGKTTLAIECGKVFEIPVIETSISKVFIDMGYDPKVKYNFETRLHIQWNILETLLAQYNSADRGAFITDRTPLDFVAYLMADMGRDTLNPALEREFMNYMAACFEVLNSYFSVVVVVQPGIKVVESKGKAAGSPAHMEHVNTIITGLAINQEINIQHTYIPRHITDLSQRVRCIEESLKIAYKSFEHFAAKRGAFRVSDLTH